MMRVLWITHDIFEVVLPYVKGRPTKGGSWIAPLFYHLKRCPDVLLGNVTPVFKGEAQKKVIDDVSYYSIRISRNENTANMTPRLASRYLKAIVDFQPDIIHVHGTEKNFGLLRKYIDQRIPIVCSIQGIVSPCYESLKLSISGLDIQRHRSLKNLLGRGGVNYSLRRWNRYQSIERELFRINHYFIGRTEWDRAYLSSINQEALYFRGEEMLRSEFYTQRWSIDRCERHRIFTSSASSPLKGFHLLLQAVALLKKDFPDIRVVAPLATVDMRSSRMRDRLLAEDYANYLKNEIKESQLQEHVLFMKRLSAAEMAREYCRAHLFVLPSYMENSPNSLGESMMVGVPSVAAKVGGVTSIISESENSLLFPVGDAVYLAHQIKRLFSNDALALNISHNARQIADKRHHIEQTTEQYHTIYNKIIKYHHENSTSAI